MTRDRLPTHLRPKHCVASRFCPTGALSALSWRAPPRNSPPLAHPIHPISLPYVVWWHRCRQGQGKGASDAQLWRRPARGKHCLAWPPASSHPCARARAQVGDRARCRSATGAHVCVHSEPRPYAVCAGCNPERGVGWSAGWAWARQCIQTRGVLPLWRVAGAPWRVCAHRGGCLVVPGRGGGGVRMEVACCPGVLTRPAAFLLARLAAQA